MLPHSGGPEHSVEGFEKKKKEVKCEEELCGNQEGGWECG